MSYNSQRGAVQVERELNDAHQRGAPPEDILKLVTEYYELNPGRREVHDIAILALIKTLQSGVIDAGTID